MVILKTQEPIFNIRQTNLKQRFLGSTLTAIHKLQGKLVKNNNISIKVSYYISI